MEWRMDYKEYLKNQSWVSWKQVYVPFKFVLHISFRNVNNCDNLNTDKQVFIDQYIILNITILQQGDVIHSTLYILLLKQIFRTSQTFSLLINIYLFIMHAIVFLYAAAYHTNCFHHKYMMLNFECPLYTLVTSFPLCLK